MNAFCCCIIHLFVHPLLKTPFSWPDDNFSHAVQAHLVTLQFRHIIPSGYLHACTSRDCGIISFTEIDNEECLQANVRDDFIKKEHKSVNK